MCTVGDPGILETLHLILGARILHEDHAVVDALRVVQARNLVDVLLLEKGVAPHIVHLFPVKGQVAWSTGGKNSR